MVVVLAAVVALAGCGGSGEQTTGSATTTTVIRGSNAPETKETNTTATVPKESKKRKKIRSETGAEKSESPPDGKHAEPAAPDTHQKSSGTDRPARNPGATDQSTAATGLEGASPVTVKKLRRRCPKGMEPAACDELVKTYLEAQNPAPAPPQPEPGQCPEALSKAECEAAVAATKTAEKGGAVNVQECLANMTPQCEEALRAAFEAQAHAQEGAGE